MGEDTTQRQQAGNLHKQELTQQRLSSGTLNSHILTDTPRGIDGTLRQRTKGCFVSGKLMWGSGQEQARSATGDQSGGKCCRVLHNTKEQSGAEQWENGACIVDRPDEAC